MKTLIIGDQRRTRRFREKARVKQSHTVRLINRMFGRLEAPLP